MIRLARKGTHNQPSDYTRHEAQALERYSTMVCVPAGRTLATQGQPGTQAILIIDGNAEVTRDAQPVATVGAGDLIGEAALLGTTNRNATIVASTQMTVRVMHPAEFASLLDECPRLEIRWRMTCVRRLAAPTVRAELGGSGLHHPVSAVGTSCQPIAR